MWKNESIYHYRLIDLAARLASLASKLSIQSCGTLFFNSCKVLPYMSNIKKHLIGTIIKQGDFVLQQGALTNSVISVHRPVTAVSLLPYHPRIFQISSKKKWFSMTIGDCKFLTNILAFISNISFLKISML